MKTVAYVFINFSLLFISCNFAPSTTKKRTIQEGGKLTIVNANLDSLSKHVVVSFYNWYVNDIYLNHIYDYDHAPYKKYGNKYGLDIEFYKKKLTEIKHFSNSYKEILLYENIKCNDAMLSSDLGDFNPEYDADFVLNDNRICQCLWSLKWFGNLEDENNKFTIHDNFTKEGNIYVYTVQDYIYDKPCFQYEVKTILENGEYKIAYINRK